jgi:hypothetical protein
MMFSKSSRALSGMTARLAQRSSRSSQGLSAVQRRTMAEMPVPQSSKAVLFEGHHREGWESTIAWFYPTSFALIVLILAGAPVTDIELWANKEAEARLKLKSEGFTDFQFGTHYQTLSAAERAEVWEKFSMKATRMTDDDDDDDEEEGK